MEGLDHIRGLLAASLPRRVKNPLRSPGLKLRGRSGHPQPRRLVDKLSDSVLGCYLWRFCLILAWRAACFGYPMNSSLPSMNIAGVIGALYLTASSGSSVTSITLQARSGTSAFIPSSTETTFSLTSRGVQHDAIRTSTFNPDHHWVARGMFVFLDLSSDAPEPTGT